MPFPSLRLGDLNYRIDLSALAVQDQPAASGLCPSPPLGWASPLPLPLE
jgi:hypothetical protein